MPFKYFGAIGRSAAALRWQGRLYALVQRALLHLHVFSVEALLFWKDCGEEIVVIVRKVDKKMNYRANSTQASIVLCTCNGEQFLQDQLDSIARQSALPFELVVADDCSSDNTLQILRQFASLAPFPVHIHQNRDRKGSTGNFNDASKLCRGNVVFFCDQDDVWYPHKLDTMVRHLSRHPEIGLVFTDAQLMDESMNEIPETLWRAVNFGVSQQRRIDSGSAFETLVQRNVVTGASMAVRKAVLDLAWPFPSIWYHDNWLALIAAAISQVDYIKEPLFRYRQHAANQIGARESSLVHDTRVAFGVQRSHYEFQHQRYAALLGRLDALRLASTRPIHECIVADQSRLQSRIQIVNSKLAHLNTRASLDVGWHRRLPKVLKEAWHGRYFRYSGGWRSIAKDIVYRNASTD